MKICLLAAIFLCICVPPAFAGPDGNQVLKKCQTTLRLVDNHPANPSDGDITDSGWCIGWIGAAIEMNYLRREMAENTHTSPDAFHFCAPEKGMQAQQAIRVVVKYLQGSPERLHENGMLLTIAALKTGFSCK